MSVIRQLEIDHYAAGLPFLGAAVEIQADEFAKIRCPCWLNRYGAQSSSVRS